MSDFLLAGWQKRNLNQVVDFVLGGDWGKDPKEATKDDLPVQVIRGTDFKDWSKNKGSTAARRCIKTTSLEKRELQEGDLVLEVSGGGPTQPVGRTVLIDKETLKRAKNPLVCSNFFRLVRLKNDVVPKYVNYYLTHSYFKGNFNEFQTQTTNLRNLNVPDFLNESTILFPILPEQRRIVAKLEKLLEKVEACQKRLDKIPTLLKRFRQSILSAACSGRLTADWRIGQKISANGSTSNSDSDLPEIPDGWNWIKLPQTGEMNRGKSRHRPRNEPSLFGGPYPFIQTGDIAQSNGKITAHRQAYTEKGLAQSRLWPIGTICITIAANIAESAILTYPACFPDSIVGVIPDSRTCLGQYVEFFIRVAKADLSTFAPATAQKNINIAILNEVNVPLPPLDEQKEIVKRAEKLFTLAAQIEARCKKAQAHIDKLTQSILAKAFRGELVPGEPTQKGVKRKR